MRRAWAGVGCEAERTRVPERVPHRLSLPPEGPALVRGEHALDDERVEAAVAAAAGDDAGVVGGGECADEGGSGLSLPPGGKRRRDANVNHLSAEVKAFVRYAGNTPLASCFCTGR